MPTAIRAIIARITRPTGLDTNEITAETPFTTEVTVRTTAMTVLTAATTPTMTAMIFAIASPTFTHLSVSMLPCASWSARFANCGAILSIILPMASNTVLMTPQMVWKIGIATFLMPCHTAVRIVLMFPQILMMLARNLSTSTPAFSSRLPSRELLPCIKLMKSSTNRATMMKAAAISRACLFTFRRPVNTACTPFTILSKLNAINRAPAEMAISFSTLSVPPSLSPSQTTAFRTRFITRMAVSENFTIARAMAFVTPSVEFIWVSQSPQLLRMFFRPSEIDIFAFWNAASISPEASMNASLSCWTVILPFDAISSSWDLATPRLCASTFAVSGACSSILFRVSVSTMPFWKDLLKPSIMLEMAESFRPFVFISFATVLVNWIASSTGKISEPALARLET